MMKAMRASVLLVSNDPMLATTRAMLLDQFEVVTASLANAQREILSEPPDLLILCQTIPDTEAQRSIENARAVFPKIEVLALCDYGQWRDLEVVVYEIQIDHPEEFIAAVAGMLHKDNPISAVCASEAR